MDIIKKAGSWFSYESGKLGQGRETVKELIKDNPELMEKLESQIRAHISGEAEAEKEAKDKAKEAKAAKAAAAASAE